MSKLQARKLPLTYERIREWMMYDGPDERPSAPRLWDEDKVVYERLIQLRTLLFQKAHGYHDAMKVMMRTYGVSEVTFNRDYRGLIYIFGDLEAESKEFERMRYKEITQKILQMALAKDDMKTANAAMANLIKLGGHDREEREGVPLELLNPGAYALVIDEAGQEALKALLSSGPVVDLGTLMGEEAQDIDFEEIPKKEAEGDE